MILSIVVPRVGEHMHRGTIHRLLAKPGDALRPGSALLEMRVDLCAAKVQDCPPILFFRIITTERAYLRSLNVAPAEVLDLSAPLGLATTEIGESLQGPAARVLRTTSVAIQVDPLSR